MSSFTFLIYHFSNWFDSFICRLLIYEMNVITYLVSIADVGRENLFNHIFWEKLPLQLQPRPD